MPRLIPNGGSRKILLYTLVLSVLLSEAQAFTLGAKWFKIAMLIRYQRRMKKICSKEMQLLSQIDNSKISLSDILTGKRNSSVSLCNL